MTCGMGKPSLHMTAAASLWRARRRSRNCCSTSTSLPVSPTGGGAQCLNKHLPRLWHGHSSPCQHSGTVDINCYAQRLMPKTERPEQLSLSLPLLLSYFLERYPLSVVRKTRTAHDTREEEAEQDICSCTRVKLHWGCFTSLPHHRLLAQFF